jgi:hypothetical protein
MEGERHGRGMGTACYYLIKSCVRLCNYIFYIDYWTQRGCLNWKYYSKLLRFWPVEQLGELAGGPTGCGEVARGACFFACNFSVTGSTVLTGLKENQGRRQCDRVNCTYGPERRTGQTNFWHAQRLPWHVAFTAVSNFNYFSRPASLYCEVYVYINRTVYEVHLLANNTAGEIFFYGSGVKCWLDIYHSGVGLSVTGRIRDIGTKVLQSSFHTKSRSSPS